MNIINRMTNKNRKCLIRDASYFYVEQQVYRENRFQSTSIIKKKKNFKETSRNNGINNSLWNNYMYYCVHCHISTYYRKESKRTSTDATNATKKNV